jgi:hypothetical protein
VKLGVLNPTVGGRRLDHQVRRSASGVVNALLHRDEPHWPPRQTKFIAAKVLNTPRGAAAGL